MDVPPPLSDLVHDVLDLVAQALVLLADAVKLVLEIILKIRKHVISHPKINYFFKKYIFSYLNFLVVGLGLEELGGVSPIK